MIRALPFVAGAALGAALARERKLRRRAERFAAASLESLLRAIDANDPQTGAHVRRVAGYSLVLADSLDIDAEERRIIELTALFHDIGKIHEALFDIVHEPRRLSASERTAIATHPARGAEVLAPIAHFDNRLSDAVFSHHERWDGTGYPRKLRGRRIPLAARVVALADTFDAITHRRRYHNGRTAVKAAEVILEGRGTQFDPEMVDLMLLPPVFDRLVREHKESRRVQTLPKRRESRAREIAPEIEIRWRTRTQTPRAARPSLTRE